MDLLLIQEQGGGGARSLGGGFLLRMTGKEEKDSRTDEVAVFYRRCIGFNLRLLIHLLVRFTYKRHLGVIAIRDPFEHIFHPEEFDYSFSMSDVRIGEQPEFDFAFIDIFEEGAQFGVRGNDGIQRKRIVDLAVILERVDFVMENQARDG